MDGFSDLACGGVGVDIVDLSVKSGAQRCQDGGEAFGKSFYDSRHIHADDFTHKAHILLFAGGGVSGKSPLGFEDLFAADAADGTAELLAELNQMGVDIVEHFIHHADGFITGVTQPVDEFDGDPLLFEGG